MAKSNEPFWWALFSAGGVVAAFLMPVTIVITSIGVMQSWMTVDKLWDLLHNPLVRIYLFVLISLPLFHWAHRFKFTLVDLGLKAASTLLSILCYGGAVAGSILALILLCRL